jgi:hypothetical protein
MIDVGGETLCLHGSQFVKILPIWIYKSELLYAGKQWLVKFLMIFSLYLLTDLFKNFVISVNGPTIAVGVYSLVNFIDLVRPVFPTLKNIDFSSIFFMTWHERIKNWNKSKLFSEKYCQQKVRLIECQLEKCCRHLEWEEKCQKLHSVHFFRTDAFFALGK